MAFLQNLLKTLQQLGVRFGPAVLVIVQILLPIAVIAGAWLWVRYKTKKAGKPDPGPAVDRGTAALPAQPRIKPGQLRAAWNRFLSALPDNFRRSILNFEHFVVLGAGASGKSHLIDASTDWRRRTREFGGSQALDSDLPVYLASNAIITEVPARVLEDHSRQCYAALRKLWRPLYKERAPTVVVVVDVMRLRTATPDEIGELAEALRAKINVLSSIRGKAVSVRFVLTHLDGVDGYGAFAEFSRRAAIPLRVAIRRDATAGPIREQILAWLDAFRAHFPRALTTISSTEFRNVITFLRSAPPAVPSIAQLVDAVLAHEPTSPDPISDGIYLASEPPGVANPLEGAAEAGPGPDPRRNHLALAAAVAGACILYLVLAYREQSALFAHATEELSSYDPSTYGSEHESGRRKAVCDFTSRGRVSVLARPDFFAAARTHMRKEFSDRVRDELLIPRLKTVAYKGMLQPGEVPLPTRRSLYFLALIHSDKDDRLNIRGEGHLQIWSSMTDLQGDMIDDYLDNTDEAYTHPVSFELPEREASDRDTAAAWTGFLRDAHGAIADGMLTPDELSDLKARATALNQALDRFDHDDVTRMILDGLDGAANTAPRTGVGPLKRAYLPNYAEFLRNISALDVLRQREPIRQILSVVVASKLESTNEVMLRDLLDRVAVLTTEPPNAGQAPETYKIHLSGQDFEFDTARWAELLRDATIEEQILRFMRHDDNELQLFFPRDTRELRPVVWNPTNDGSMIFVGKGVIDGRYTRVAYEKDVRDVVARISEIPDKPESLAARKKELVVYVRDRVARYAGEYRRQLDRFYNSYGIRASSQEALRVAVSQIVSDSSPFTDFLTAVDTNASIDAEAPGLEPMRDVAAAYATLHAVIGGPGGSTELAKYKTIMGQLLVDLGPPPEQAAAPGAEAPETSGKGAAKDTLQSNLTPAGKLVLANLRAEKGSYAGLVAAWLASVKLPDWQRPAFTAPVDALSGVGRRDVERAIALEWDREMLPPLQQIAALFPFDPSAKVDATPQAVWGLFHPQEGKFFDVYRRFIEPIAETDNGKIQERRSMRGRITVPPLMFAIINKAVALSALLWDANGRAKPIEFRAATIPFENGTDPSLALTLVYLNVGDTSLINFNQKPTEKVLRLDWTKDQISQVGVQLTDLGSKDNVFPDPIVADSPSWSVLHLLQKAKVSPVKYPPDAALYTWEIRNSKGKADVTHARYAIIGDLWQPFAFGKLLKTPVAQQVLVN